MIETLFSKKSITLEYGNDATVSYYATMHDGMHGIKIVFDNSGMSNSAEFDAISCDRYTIGRVLDKMQEYDVTPMSAEYILDELFEKALAS